MSSAVISTTAAQGCFFVFDAESSVCLQPSGAELFGVSRSPQRALPADFKAIYKDARLAGVTPASHLGVRPAPEMVSSGIAALDALTGGLPRGCLTEICGPASSGRTTLLLSALAAATQRGEVCAVVDASDALDPHSLAATGVELNRLLWVRCSQVSPQRPRAPGKKSDKQNFQLENESRSLEHRLEQLLRATDLLLESGGFGLIALDLADLPPQAARRIPMTTWFRFRRAVERTPTVLLALERQSIAGSCSSLLLKLAVSRNQQHWNFAAGHFDDSTIVAVDSGLAAERRKNAAHGVSRGCAIDEDKQAPEGRKKPTHAHLLTEIKITAEILRSRLDRKPSGSVTVNFACKTPWAG